MCGNDVVERQIRGWYPGEWDNFSQVGAALRGGTMSLDFVPLDEMERRGVASTSSGRGKPFIVASGVCCVFSGVAIAATASLGVGVGLAATGFSALTGMFATESLKARASDHVARVEQALSLYLGEAESPSNLVLGWMYQELRSVASLPSIWKLWSPSVQQRFVAVVRELAATIAECDQAVVDRARVGTTPGASCGRLLGAP